jgi:flagellar biosynthesis anti-sigma factor FlgM
MNVQNDLQGLQQLFSSPEVRQGTGKAGAAQAEGVGTGGDQASLSTAASAASTAAADSDVRMEKVAAVQQALLHGTYQVPASEVANKMIDHMLGKQG